ncbi:MAG: ABC transporter permease [Candidatus Latescibacteria bacterium]|nr:ABC transporter permease [Candidatus Latescibacterota bacterium]
MKKLLNVAMREYIETIKTKTFLISILITPLIVGGIVFLSVRIQKQTFSAPRPTMRIAILNRSKPITEELETVFKKYNSRNPTRRIEMEQIVQTDDVAVVRELKRRVVEGDIDGYLLLADTVLDGEGHVSFFSKKLSDFAFTSTVERLVNEAVINTRYRREGLSPDVMSRLLRRVQIDQVDVGLASAHRLDRVVRMIVPFVFLFMMFIGIVTVSQGLLLSVIEMKSSRVIEVLLAAVTPFQLMAGQILGQAAIGLSIMGVYGIAAFITAIRHGLEFLIQPGLAAYFLVYYILGFLVISSIISAVGSICNSVKDAQGFMSPIMLLLILPMFLWMPVTQNPEGTLATVLSFIPPITPMVMILRISANPDLPAAQIHASIIVLALSVPVVMAVAAKIFRTGVLMYGKQPGIRELLRWLLSS